MKTAQYTNSNGLPPHIATTAMSVWEFLGSKPHNLGVVATLYPQLTASFLTEGLLNVYRLGSSSGNKWQSINSMCFEWSVNTNFIKTVPLAADPIGDGVNGSSIKLIFSERYYEQYDTFYTINTQQNFFVLQEPVKGVGNTYEYLVKFIDDTTTRVIDPALIHEGTETYWTGNAHPEVSSNGYTKYQSSIEKHRQWLHIIRNDISASSMYSANEDSFLKIYGKQNGKEPIDTFYKLTSQDQQLLDSFYESKNKALLFDQTTMDANGKCTLFVDNQPVIIGDGIIAQVEKFATPFYYNKLTIDFLNKVLITLSEKNSDFKSNNYTFICNRAFYNSFQTTIVNTLKDISTSGTFFYSIMNNGGKVDVGTDFDTYSFAGNSITLMLDTSFNYYINDKPYALCMNTMPNMKTGDPSFAQFTLSSYEMIRNKIIGVGNKIEDVSSKLSATTQTITGVTGVGVFIPYRHAFIIGPKDSY